MVICLKILTLYLTNSIFMLLHFEAFLFIKSNKLVILVHFIDFFRMQSDQPASSPTADRLAS